jgi:hypothetical protein
LALGASAEPPDTSAALAPSAVRARALRARAGEAAEAVRGRPAVGGWGLTTSRP